MNIMLNTNELSPSGFCAAGARNAVFSKYVALSK